MNIQVKKFYIISEINLSLYYFQLIEGTNARARYEVMSNRERKYSYTTQSMEAIHHKSTSPYKNTCSERDKFIPHFSVIYF
jgi:hypothetical protein